MAGTSLLALIDDIATILDDVTIMSKVAVKKTAGVLGDDLALNAQQVSGVSTERELPVVLAVARGSAINKVILVPAALAISVFIPWAITPFLIIGGIFLCYEGSEKIAHKLFHSKDEDDQHYKELIEAANNPAIDLLAFERDKIKGAIRTDFILSAEIVVISLGAVAQSEFKVQVLTLCAIAVLMTIGVYGLVAGIVKLDDLGIHLSRKTNTVIQKIGLGILVVAPWLMKSLSVVGTAAMFMVGGGIISHGIPFIHHAIDVVRENLSQVPAAGNFLAGLTGLVLEASVGILAGMITLLVVKCSASLRRTRSGA